MAQKLGKVAEAALVPQPYLAPGVGDRPVVAVAAEDGPHGRGRGERRRGARHAERFGEGGGAGPQSDHAELIGRRGGLGHESGGASGVAGTPAAVKQDGVLDLCPHEERPRTHPGADRKRLVEVRSADVQLTHRAREQPEEVRERPERESVRPHQPLHWLRAE